MKILSEKIVQFFHNQGFVIVSTADKKGSLHNSCKGLIDIDKKGELYLFDLYQERTYTNLKQNQHISVTAVDEHRFKGYCLKGKAKIIYKDKFSDNIIRAWEERITSRITQRVVRNIREEKGHPRHPEALLPKPAYMIVMKVGEIVDLTPYHLR